MRQVYFFWCYTVPITLVHGPRIQLLMEDTVRGTETLCSSTGFRSNKAPNGQVNRLDRVCQRAQNQSLGVVHCRWDVHDDGIYWPQVTVRTTEPQGFAVAQSVTTKGFSVFLLKYFQITC